MSIIGFLLSFYFAFFDYLCYCEDDQNFRGYIMGKKVKSLLLSGLLIVGMSIPAFAGTVNFSRNVVKGMLPSTTAYDKQKTTGYQGSYIKFNAPATTLVNLYAYTTVRFTDGTSVKYSQNKLVPTQTGVNTYLTPYSQVKALKGNRVSLVTLNPHWRDGVITGTWNYR